MVTLRSITDDNLWEVIRLTVFDEQKSFVASNTTSLLEAYLCLKDPSSDLAAMPFAIYADEELVGFLMLGYLRKGGEDAPEVTKNSYILWRIMIDKAHQNKGYGRAAIQAALEYIHTKPCGEAEYCTLSYEPENDVAKKLYASFGFEENGEMDEDEVIAVKKL